MFEIASVTVVEGDRHPIIGNNFTALQLFVNAMHRDARHLLRDHRVELSFERIERDGITPLLGALNRARGRRNPMEH